MQYCGRSSGKCDKKTLVNHSCTKWETGCGCLTTVGVEDRRLSYNLNFWDPMR